MRSSESNISAITTCPTGVVAYAQPTISKANREGTSNKLAFVLVQVTESLIDCPLYCTGIWNPPNSTIVPPSFTCVSYNAVRRSDPEAEVAYWRECNRRLLVRPATSLIMPIPRILRSRVLMSRSLLSGVRKTIRKLCCRSEFGDLWGNDQRAADQSIRVPKV